MSGRNIKIELELPDFEKELNITVTLQRDGEVLSCTSSTSNEESGKYKNVPLEPLENFGKPITETPKTCKQSVPMDSAGSGWKQDALSESETVSSGNNFMNLNF